MPALSGNPGCNDGKQSDSYLRDRLCGGLTILSLLAGVIAGICKLFPVKATDLPDPGAEEALRQAVSKAFPGCRVSEIREVKS